MYALITNLKCCNAADQSESHKTLPWLQVVATSSHWDKLTFTCSYKRQIVTIIVIRAIKIVTTTVIRARLFYDENWISKYCTCLLCMHAPQRSIPIYIPANACICKWDNTYFWKSPCSHAVNIWRLFPSHFPRFTCILTFSTEWYCIPTWQGWQLCEVTHIKHVYEYKHAHMHTCTHTHIHTHTHTHTRKLKVYTACSLPIRLSASRRPPDVILGRNFTMYHISNAVEPHTRNHWILFATPYYRKWAWS